MYLHMCTYLKIGLLLSIIHSATAVIVPSGLNDNLNENKIFEAIEFKDINSDTLNFIYG